MSLTGSRFSSESAPGPFHHVLKRQDRNGRLVGHRRWALSLSNTLWSSLLRFVRRTHLISPDWLLNVLYLLNTKVHEGHRQDLAYLIVRHARNTHASWLRNRLQPRGNVHAVAEEVSRADHHVADVDTHG